jgi:large subunit ribosomal protein L4
MISRINIINPDNSVSGELELNPSIFECDYRMDSMWHRFRPVHEVVRWQMNKAREAIQCVKNRSQVSGSNKKMHPQKESGKARQGNGKACHLRGGGAAFKINSRNYEFKINKKYHSLAKRIVLSHKFMNGGVLVLQDLSKFDLSKTKDAATFLKTLGHDRVLFVTQRDLYKGKSLKGIQSLYKVDSIPSSGLNVKSMLDRTLIFDVNSINEVQDILLQKNKLEKNKNAVKRIKL